MRAAVTLTLFLASAAGGNGQTPAAVALDARTVLTVHTALGGVPAEARAAGIAGRLDSVAKNRKIAADCIRVEESPAKGSLIVCGDSLLMSVSDAEASAAGQPRAALAAANALAMRRAVLAYRDDWSAKHVLEGSLYALLASVIFFALLFALARAHRLARLRILAWSARTRTLGRLYDSGVLSARRVAAILLTAAGALRWFLVLVLLQAYVTALFSSFPGTSGLASGFSSWILSPLTALWTEFVGYLPRLLFVIVISILTFYILKLNRFLSLEVRDGKIAIPGFYPDWAESTSRLIAIVIFVLAAVAVFPYLPGSSSPAFKGISILIGVVLSFGSGSATANVISGAILTYMRPYQLGDRVKIDNTIGDVVEKSLLVTRIQTIKNVVITIPNSNILGAHILNYSTLARENRLIVHTTATIGYGVPWRKVHDLLIAAAARTPGVLAEPLPFVFQTALNDFYISYEINAYTADANHIDDISSALHQSIQDSFGEAGVEIMSPHTVALRDGSGKAIPGMAEL